MNNKRQLLQKALYRHFKGDIYATMFISKPLDIESIIDKKLNKTNLIVTHTESMNDIVLFKDDGDNIFHALHVSSDVLVIYVSLNTGKTYARPINMFLSEVDKEKYPASTQKYRFELVNNTSSTNKNNTIDDRDNIIITDVGGVLVFGDGKIAIAQSVYKDKDKKCPILIFSELQKPHEIGKTYPVGDKDLSKDLFFIFKNKESIKSLQDTLQGCITMFEKEDI